MRWLILVVALLLVTGWGKTASAEKLELGFLGNPTWMHDKNAEAISSDNLLIGRFGVDLRSEVYKADRFSLSPLLAYRYGIDSGYLPSFTDTEIRTHDILAGLRLRHGLLPWLTAFLEVHAGAEIAALSAEMSGNYSLDVYEFERDQYTDRVATWSAGVLIGFESHLSRTWLESRGIDWFCLGGEVAFGYIRRGDMAFNPDLDVDENSIEIVSAGGWGDLNLSGMVLQFGLSLYFF